MKKLAMIMAAATAASMALPAHALKRTTGGVLDPSQFHGFVKQAYATAAANVGLAQQLFCYCGCDKEAHHHALIDCYTSDHSIYCMTCKDEMVRAAMYKRQGMPIGQIQHAIDREFSAAYPFSKKSSAYLSYKAREVGGGGGKTIASGKGKSKAVSKTVASTAAKPIASTAAKPIASTAAKPIASAGQQKSNKKM